MSHDKGRQQRPAPSNRSGSGGSSRSNPKKGSSPRGGSTGGKSYGSGSGRTTSGGAKPSGQKRYGGSSGSGKPGGGTSSGGKRYGGSSGSGKPGGGTSSGGKRHTGTSSGVSGRGPRAPGANPHSGSGRGASGASSPSGGNAAPGGKKSQYTATTRSVEEQRRAAEAKRRRDLKGYAVNLPNWVIEGLVRVTPRDRVAPALEALGAASDALADGRYQAAVKHGNRAKALAPQDPTVRETIGVAAYRMGDWNTALSELRAYRRMQGDTTHLPIEMDVLRAQKRPKDVETAWNELQKRGGHGLVMNEGTIVYASFLLDAGRVDEAWAVIDPGQVKAAPNEGHLRRYYVAARVAAARGDRSKARRLSDAIVTNDPSFPGYEELEAEIASIRDA